LLLSSSSKLESLIQTLRLESKLPENSLFSRYSICCIDSVFQGWYQ